MQRVETGAWFPFYDEDFWSAREVVEMGIQRAGYYLRLLCYQWRYGSVPARLEGLQNVLAGLTLDETREAWVLIAPCFIAHPNEPGRLLNLRLETIRQQQYARSAALRAGGAAGGRKRAENAAAKAAVISSLAQARLEKEPDSPRNEATLKPGLAESEARLEPGLKKTVENPSLCGTELLDREIVSNDTISPACAEGGLGGRSGEVTEGEISAPLADPGRSPETSLGASEPSAPLLTGIAEPPATRKVNPRVLTPKERDAYAILAHCWPIVLHDVQGLATPERVWKARNKGGALAFAEQGWTPERVGNVLKFAHTDPEACVFYGELARLDKLLDAIPRLTTIRNAVGKRKGASGLTHGAIVG